MIPILTSQMNSEINPTQEEEKNNQDAVENNTQTTTEINNMETPTQEELEEFRRRGKEQNDAEEEALREFNSELFK